MSLADCHQPCQTEGKTPLGGKSHILFSGYECGAGATCRANGTTDERSAAATGECADESASAGSASDPSEIPSLMRTSSDGDGRTAHRNGFAIQRE